MLTPAPWEELQGYHWVARLHHCPQSPVHHGEGDVGCHTRMVLEALVDSAEYQALPAPDQEVVWNAALFHDVAKPDCTRPEEGWAAPGHSRRGAQLTREILWRLDCPPSQREQIAALVTHHMVPFWLVDDPDPRPRLLRLSLTARCDLLAVLARADARGRICPDQARLLHQVDLFAELAREHSVERGPRAFPSDHGRLTYFRQGGDPDRSVHFQPRCRVTVLAGLPGSGKDSWIESSGGGLPVVSLDLWRQRLGIHPSQTQGAVVDAARQEARGLLRQGCDFIWNATHLSRELRGRTLSLLWDYGAQIRLLHLETRVHELYRRNRERAAPVQPGVLDQMVRRWEFPDASEAHQLECLVT